MRDLRVVAFPGICVQLRKSGAKVAACFVRPAPVDIRSDDAVIDSRASGSCLALLIYVEASFGLIAFWNDFGVRLASETSQKIMLRSVEAFDIGCKECGSKRRNQPVLAALPFMQRNLC